MDHLFRKKTVIIIAVLFAIALAGFFAAPSEDGLPDPRPKLYKIKSPDEKDSLPRNVVAISPSLVETSAEAGAELDPIRVINTIKQPVRVEIGFFPYSLKDGRPTANFSQNKKTNQDYLQFSSDSFVLPPLTEKEVFIRLLKVPEDQNYLAGAIIAQSSFIGDQPSFLFKKKKSQIKITPSLRVESSLFVETGPASQSNFSIKGPYLFSDQGDFQKGWVRFKNTGDSILSPSGSFALQKETIPIGPGQPILPGATAWISADQPFSLKPKEGDVLNASVVARGQGKSISGSVSRSGKVFQEKNLAANIDFFYPDGGKTDSWNSRAVVTNTGAEDLSGSLKATLYKKNKSIYQKTKRLKNISENESRVIYFKIPKVTNNKDYLLLLELQSEGDLVSKSAISISPEMSVTFDPEITKPSFFVGLSFLQSIFLAITIIALLLIVALLISALFFKLKKDS